MHLRYFGLTNFLVVGGTILFALLRHGRVDAIVIDLIILFFWWQTRESERPQQAPHPDASQDPGRHER